ncbi:MULTISPECIES: hypothetical protein [unclassified Crossiella]|uniref:hypothetical protein n=1 Tax=unclassified Crossiella TaxID=2620835 RepID=UPI001FFE880F|nr:MULTISPECIES: hypothetical protein [unclassified Crossiella]MCK2236977.1 hypothetical protein [Crossiella sp. S99.2]MCK2250645.1 hypothetical protein [Crossiella sp. S99.1]
MSFVVTIAKLQEAFTPGLTGYAKTLEQAISTGEAYDRSIAQDTQALERGRQVIAKAPGDLGKSDELLDAARPALLFFDRFLPLYNKWTYSALSLQEEVYAKFDRFRGIDFARFRADSESLRSVRQELVGADAVLRKAHDGLSTQWRGKAADGATEHIDRYLTVTDEVNRRFTTISAHTDNLTNGLVRDIQRLATEVIALHSADCGGYTPHQVDEMINFVRGETGMPLANAFSKVLSWTGDTSADVVKELPNVGSAAAAGVIKVLNAIRKSFEERLNERFAKNFTEKLKTFQDTLCKGREAAIREMWDGFRGATAKFTDHPFEKVPLLPPRGK